MGAGRRRRRRRCRPLAHAVIDCWSASDKSPSLPRRRTGSRSRAGRRRRFLHWQDTNLEIDFKI